MFETSPDDGKRLIIQSQRPFSIIARSIVYLLLNLMLFSLLMVVPSAPSYAKEIHTADEGLVITLTLESERYAEDEVILATVSIENKGTEPVAIYRRKNSRVLPGLQLAVYDDQGNILGRRDPICQPRYPDPSIDDFLTIQPGDAVSFVIETSIPLESIPGPGRYRMEASYLHPVLQNILEYKLPLWARSNGPISSPPLVFHVEKVNAD